MCWGSFGNEAKMFGDLDRARMFYGWIDEKARGDACIECGERLRSMAIPAAQRRGTATLRWKSACRPAEYRFCGAVGGRARGTPRYEGALPGQHAPGRPCLRPVYGAGRVALSRPRQCGRRAWRPPDSGPPYVVTEDQLDTIVATLRQAILEVAART